MRFLITAVLCLRLLSCKDDDDPELPAPTKRGLNTFGCLVNKKVMVPGGHYGRLSAEVSQSGFVWITSGSSDTDEVVDILIKRDNVPIETGVRYEFDNVTGISCFYNNFHDKKETCMYRDVPVKGGITFTEINWEYQIIAGTFDFEVYSDECDKSVSITEGRFDIIFYYH